MASSSKKRTTMAKIAREHKLREKRAEKQARKEARKHSVAEVSGGPEGTSVSPVDRPVESTGDAAHPHAPGGIIPND